MPANPTFYTPYKPSRPLFPRIRPFIPPSDIMPQLYDVAYEIVTGEKLIKILLDGDDIVGTFVDLDGVKATSRWSALNGRSLEHRKHKYARKLQIQEDLLVRFQAYVASLADIEITQ